LKPTTKKILIWIASIIGVGVLGYALFVGYVVYSFTSGCGMDDGPFEARTIKAYQVSDSAQHFTLTGGAELILDNRADSLSPTFTLIESNNVTWTLDTDVSYTKGYETCGIWEIENLVVRNDSDPIVLHFTAYWTFGGEAGSMEIDRKTGENNFCLSW